MPACAARHLPVTAMKTLVTIAAAAALSVPACGPTQPAVRFPAEADQILRAGAVREIAGFLADPNLVRKTCRAPGVVWSQWRCRDW